MSNELDLDGFLHHSGNEGKASYLTKWKKQKGEVQVFLHTKAPIIILWQHNIPLIKKVKRDGIESLEVWSQGYNCFEAESVLKQQHKRDKETGARIAPPHDCPVCKLVEWVRGEVDAGNIDWTDEIFQFKGDDPKKYVTLHAAGIYGGFNGDLEPEQMAQLRAASIFRNEVWKENMQARLNYLFRVVDANNVAAGVQKAIETQLLGDKVKGVIFDAQKSLGVDGGNPMKNPYCIQWEAHPEAKEFQKKYHAVKIDVVKPTKEIMRLIRETDPPDVKWDLQKPNLDELRASLENSCLIKGVPWDRLFDKPKGYQVPVDFPYGANAPEAESDEMVACDACGKPMRLKDSICPHCSHKHDVEPEEPPAPKAPPSPPPMRSRSEAKKKVPPAPSPVVIQVKDDDVPFLNHKLTHKPSGLRF